MDNQVIKYSVIIPHYRDFDGLKGLIPSIPEREDIQVIIVDDNSYQEKGKVESFIGSFKRDNIDLYYNDPNKRGAGCCRNIGIEKSTGKWLIFADSDDFFLENAFEAFDRYVNSSADYIHFHMNSINLPEKTPGTRHLQNEFILKQFCKKRSHRNEMNLRYNIDSPCAKMVNANFVKDYNILYGETRWCNDTMFAVQCGYYANRIDVSDDVVYCATRKSGSMTTSHSVAIRKVFVDVYIKKIIFMKERLPYWEFRKSIRWPGYKLLNGLLDGYGAGFTDYVRSEYKKSGISLWWINKYDLIELVIKINTYLRDRQYTKVTG